MVQVYEDQPSFGQLFAAGTGKNIGAALTGGLEGYIEGRKSKQENKTLRELTGRDLSGLSPELKKIFVEKLAKMPEHEKLVKTFIDQGIDPKDAEFYAMLTAGGQTAFAKDILEGRKRKNKDQRTKQFEPIDEKENISLSPEEQVGTQLEDYLEDKDYGLTPAEKVKRQSERYKTNLPIYQEAGTRLRGLTRDKERIGILESIDKTDKLPKNLGRLNVDEGGNLRFPFASSPEAQRYVKTLNEFSAGAKDTFGSRVTNFDLQQYLLRYPNLLNSKKGREQIYQQMKIVNDINSIYYKNLKNVYDKAGGIRNIDPDIAESLAEQIPNPQIEELTKKFNEIGTFPTLPDPASSRGRKIRNRETGEILQSDGQNWNPVGQ